MVITKDSQTDSLKDSLMQRPIDLVIRTARLMAMPTPKVITTDFPKLMATAMATRKVRQMDSH